MRISVCAAIWRVQWSAFCGCKVSEDVIELGVRREEYENEEGLREPDGAMNRYDPESYHIKFQPWILYVLAFATNRKTIASTPMTALVALPVTVNTKYRSSTLHRGPDSVEKYLPTPPPTFLPQIAHQPHQRPDIKNSPNIKLHPLCNCLAPEALKF